MTSWVDVHLYSALRHLPNAGDFLLHSLLLLLNALLSPPLPINLLLYLILYLVYELLSSRLLLSVPNLLLRLQLYRTLDLLQPVPSSGHTTLSIDSVDSLLH